MLGAEVGGSSHTPRALQTLMFPARREATTQRKANIFYAQLLPHGFAWWREDKMGLTHLHFAQKMGEKKQNHMKIRTVSSNIICASWRAALWGGSLPTTLSAASPQPAKRFPNSSW